MIGINFEEKLKFLINFYETIKNIVSKINILKILSNCGNQNK